MSVWSRINGVAGNLRSNITQLAAEVLEAVDEARASDDEEFVHQRQHEASAPSSVGGSAVTSRLSALKARLEADRHRSAAPEDVRQHSRPAHEEKGSVTAPEPHSTGSRNNQTSAVPHNDHAQRNVFEEVMLKSPVKEVHNTGSSATPYRSPGSDLEHGSEVDQLKRQLQRLKSELVNTAASHEEEQETTEKAHKGHIDAMAREMAHLKEQLDSAKRTASQVPQQQQDALLDNGVAHARIMELQVRIKELQAENSRLAEESRTKQASASIPFGTATDAASVNTEAETEQVQQLQAEVQALREAAELSNSSERSAHTETCRLLAESQDALQEATCRERTRVESADQAHAALQKEVDQLRAALQSQQQTQSALDEEQSAHALTRQRLAEAEESLQSRCALLDRQLNEERLKQSQTSCELEKLRQQLGSSLGEVQQELQAEQQRCRHAQEELDRVRQELSEAVQARTETNDALSAERAAKEALHMLESLPAVVELREQLQEEQLSKIQLQQESKKLAQDNDRLRAEAEQLQDITLALTVAEARARAMETEAASCRREAEQQRMAVADLQTRFAETATALKEEQHDREQLQRHLETAAHASYEAQINLQQLQQQIASEQDAHRKSQAEVERMRADLEQLQDALDASAAALPERDAFWKEELQRVQRDLHSSQAQVAELQDRCHAAEAKLVNGNASPGVQALAVSSNGDVEGTHTLTENPLFGEEGSPAKGSQPQQADKSAELAHLKELLAAAEGERDRARQQLNRLKQATMAEQEDEEDKMRWRIEAEVRLALEAAQQAEAQQKAHYERELADLKAGLDASKAQAERMSNDVEAWNAAVAARDAEIQNLQAALGELAYSSEAAERLRAELRASAAKLRTADEEVAATNKELAEVGAARQTLEDELAALKQEQQKQSDFAARLSDEILMLRRALAESMKRLKLAHSDADAMVDRRIVTKLLITYFERGRSDQSVLNLMASMLGFTEEEKRKVGLASKPGILRTVAGAPLALVKGLAKGGGDGPGTPTSGDASLANEWVEFLIQQAEAADAVEANGRGSGAGLKQSELQMQPT